MKITEKGQKASEQLRQQLLIGPKGQTVLFSLQSSTNRRDNVRPAQTATVDLELGALWSFDCGPPQESATDSFPQQPI